MREIHYRNFSHKNYRFILTAPLVLQTRIKYRATRNDWITLQSDGSLIIAQGYAWDGASGIAINTQNTIAASCGHDALYQLMRLELLQKTQRLKADECLRDWLIEDGVFSLRANVWFVAVRLFGEFYLSEKN